MPGMLPRDVAHCQGIPQASICATCARSMPWPADEAAHFVHMQPPHEAQIGLPCPMRLACPPSALEACSGEAA